MNELKGTDISTVYTEYENIIVVGKDDNKYYLDPKTLPTILKNIKFKVQKKRTRSWLCIE